MSINGTHLVVCKNPDTLEHLKNEYILLGADAENGWPMSQGDALCARDELIEAGFRWGEDFYIKKIKE